MLRTSLQNLGLHNRIATIYFLGFYLRSLNLHLALSSISERWFLRYASKIQTWPTDKEIRHAAIHPAALKTCLLEISTWITVLTLSAKNLG